MRALWLLLFVLIGWPIALWQRARARRRLHARHDRLSLTVERVA
jgi:hypothetical protein